MNEGARAWVAEATGAGVTQAARLAGSSSSTLWELEAGGRRYVLRALDNAEWLKQEPDLVAHEAAALRHAREAGLPAPEPVAVEESGRVCGAPLLLMSRLPGAVLLRPRKLDDWLRQQADMLRAIHRVAAQDFGWQWFRWGRRWPHVPEWSEAPDAWERAIDIIAGGPPAAEECFIHRDYHPVNLLWEGERLGGVVDWVNACRGPAAVDVAHCRGNLCALYGIEVAERFLEHYRQPGGPDEREVAWWDLMSLMEGLPGPPAVYPGWAPFGVRHITAGMLRALADARLLAALRRLEA